MEAADMEHIMKAFAESYKLLRKNQKEEIDPLITAILKGTTIEKKKIEKIVSFEELEGQIEEFVKNAYEQNYLTPNRIIPKSQRPKWRFIVKNFIKELEKTVPEDDNYQKSVKLLTELYNMLCDGCRKDLFPTDDPFRSIVWEQEKLFEIVVKKTFAAGYAQEDIVRLLLSAVTSGLSSEVWHIDLEKILIDGLKTREAKCIAIEEAKNQIGERTKKLEGMKKYDNGRYSLEIDVNEYCNVIVLFSIKLAEAEKGVTYYFEHCKKKSKEDAFCDVLNVIDKMKEDDLWMKVYEHGVQNNIKMRANLTSIYEYRKKRNNNHK